MKNIMPFSSTDQWVKKNHEYISKTADKQDI